MKSRTEKNCEKAEILICSLLKDAYLQAFSYDSFFTLRFERMAECEFNAHKLPRNIDLRIQTEWWFDSIEEWRNKVNKYSANEIIEPVEPILSYELTCLKWLDSEIETINFSDNSMKLIFKNKKSITIMNKVDMDYAWYIFDSNVSEQNAVWSVCCEDGLYVRTPI